MKILLTGANGYIGRRIIPILLDRGDHVVCLVRDRRRFPERNFARLTGGAGKIQVIEADLLDPQSLNAIPHDIEIAYYLVHSMGSGEKNFFELEKQSAQNFTAALEATQARQVIYLSGIVNQPKESLSPHLASRVNVEDILKEGAVPTTILRAAIIVGAGSASFEVIRDLVEKLPVMIAPRWLQTPCQPVAIRNVIDYLTAVVDHPEMQNETFDIAGPESMTYEEVLLSYAEARQLKRQVIRVPFLTPRLSSYWLYFVTSTSYALARCLINSLTHDMTSSENRIRELIPVELISFHDACQRAFTMIEQNQVLSSWIDSIVSGKMNFHELKNIEVPQHGVYQDIRELPFDRDPAEVSDNIWSIGGTRGWYSMDWAWQLRGWMDRMVGGTGLRRGRRDPIELNPGDAVDFWRVLVSDPERKRLALYAEMKLPGEAWLEFRISSMEEPTSDISWRLKQTATFRPKGIMGRLYWLAVLPFHHFVFNQMAQNLVNYRRKDYAETTTTA